MKMRKQGNEKKVTLKDLVHNFALDHATGRFTLEEIFQEMHKKDPTSYRLVI